MNDQSINFTTLTVSETSIQKSIARRLLMLGSTVGLFGGTFVLMSAILSTIYDFLLSDQPQGSWLFLVVLPLWVFGAWCFDRSENGTGGGL